MGKKILLMYITEHSGHHQASKALEKAILKCDPESSVRQVNALRYTNPLAERLVHLLYMHIIRRKPRIWDNLYDEPGVARKTKRLRDFFYNAGTKKIKRLVQKFKPDAVICTQAYPCDLMSRYKERYGEPLPLIGALTDHAAHSYWINNSVDFYVVPSEEARDMFIGKGVSGEKIKILGTPIDPDFGERADITPLCEKHGLDPEKKTVLIMGGCSGICIDVNLVNALDASDRDFQILVATGVNKKLFKELQNIKNGLTKKMAVLGFADNVHQLMAASEAIITKPGGLTTAEALARNLPIIILNPLPGQETYNTNILTESGLAVKALDEEDAVKMLEKILDDRDSTKLMKERMRKKAKPNSSSLIADLLFKMVS